VSPEARRRIGALAALAAGLFALLTLVPVGVTGPVGRGLGATLTELLGLGALALPLLGLGLGLAGFERLGGLDMKRTAILVVGLGVLVPYLLGAVGQVTLASFDPAPADRALLPRLVGTLPGLAAVTISSAIGVAGATLLGFLLLSALTILTIAWHPLQRLEKGAAPAGPRAGRRRAEPAEAREAAPVVVPGPVEAVADEPAPPPPRPRKERARPRGEPTLEDLDELPPVDLLAAPSAKEGDAGEAQLDRLGELLLETLRTFKVEATIAGRTTGPVVTQYEVVPAPGVKAQRIIGLADDLAMAMRAASMRVAPIPGKGAVGVEVPNPRARMVTLRELFEAGDWHASRATLPVALGRDLEGKPVVADLARMPHLLIAGATGSGKSVAINTIITSLVYRYTPRELRLLLVDPKMVELSVYNALPHLRHKVVTANSDAAALLKWAVFEMNRRYALLQANGARNLADFNAKVAEGRPLRNPAPPKPTLADLAAEPETTPPPDPAAEAYRDGPLPYIVVVIDELADLMMTVQAEVETPLAMLAQKARAIGIHLILATQRPSVNVITGLIKANFPSRIAFKVASKVDSRTILDQNGAEALLGNGDMLFLPPGRSEPMRLQGAFIGTAETERVMAWYEERRAALAAQARQEADILEEIRAQEAADEEGPGEADSGERDPLFREAAELCIQNQGGSTSLLQRRLRIGYGRAARIIDQLHFAGVLGPPDGSKPREVLIGMHQLDEYAG